MSKIDRSTENLTWRHNSNPYPALFGSEKGKASSASKKRQVLLMGDGNAFADGIANLLSRQPKFSVRHANYLNDVSILREVAQNRPDVVVLILSRAMNLESIVSMFMSAKVFAHLRLVILRMDTSKIEIYETGNTVDGIESTIFTPVNVEDFLLLVNKSWNSISNTQSL